MTSILQAVNSGDVNEVIRLINEGIPINVKDNDGKTALINACIAKKTACFTLLLENGADVEATDAKSNTALCTASLLGQEECVQLLLSHGAETSVVNQDGDTPLMLALTNGHTSCAKLLIKAMKEASMNIINKNGVTALILAAEGGHLNVLQDLLSNNADYTVCDKESKTALLWAAERGNSDCLRTLLDAGANLFDRDEDSETLLTIAAIQGHSECVRILLEKGMDVNDTNDHLITPLMYAAYAHELDCVKLLLKSGANVNVVNMNEETALFMASYGQNVEVVNALYEAGADPEIAEHRGFTPLMYSAREGYTDLLKLHLSKEDKKKKTDEIHYKALIYSIECVRPESLVILLEDQVFDWKWFSHVEPAFSLKMLLKAVVNSSIPLGRISKENGDLTPLQFALLNNDIAMVKYLFANMYLTEYDYRFLPRDSEFLNQVLRKGNSKLIAFFFDFRHTLWPLSTLSLLTISSSIGHHKDRKNFINQLPLPDFMKTKLKFETYISKLCICFWNDLFGHKSQGIKIKEKSIDLLHSFKPIWPTPNLLITCKGEYCCAGNGFSILPQFNEDEPL